MMYYNYRNKYKNQPINDPKYGRFDSKGEYSRFIELKILEQQGVISNLNRQVRFELIPAQKSPSGKTYRKSEYIADFVYDKDGKTIVEDYKGVETDVFKLKRKLMLLCYGIEIETSK